MLAFCAFGDYMTRSITEMVVDTLFSISGVASALFTIPQIIRVWATHTQHVEGMSLLT